MTNLSNEDLGSDDKQNSGVAAVDRALLILASFDIENPSLSLAEISRRTKLYKSTILRLLNSLERHGYIRKSTDGLYSLSIMPLKLARIYQNSFNLKDIIYPILEKISEETGETSSFYILDNESRVVLFRIEPVRSVKVSISEGDVFPVNVGASGKILSAFSKKQIEAKLESIKENYWASSFGERDPETSSLSVPVLDGSQHLQGALTISGPSERLTSETIDDYIPHLMKYGITISKQLGANTMLYEEAHKKLS